MTSFKDKLKEHNIKITRGTLKTLQIDMGNLCNQTCPHCIANASPKGEKNMTRITVERIVELIKKEPNLEIIDIMGGAPELNPNFRYLISEIYKTGKIIIDRCNLTVLLEDGQEDTIDFLAKHKVRIFASLPCYTEANVDKQRGTSVFYKSITALQQLNAAGYGKPGSGLTLNLVYNPIGAFLPARQSVLEGAYHNHLRDKHNIQFNRLIAVTNMPIKRFSLWLCEEGIFKEYMKMLEENFSKKTAENLMCGHQLSIGWNGQIYDCCFNNALGISVSEEENDIWKIDMLSAISSEVNLGDYCYGCTAGEDTTVGVLC